MNELVLTLSNKVEFFIPAFIHWHSEGSLALQLKLQVPRLTRHSQQAV